ncbi:diguanylate cyclase [Rhodanobacter sp. BL-MT-08]
MKWVLAIAFVLLHVAAIAFWSAHAMFASYAFLIAAPLLGAAIAFRRCRIEGFAPARGWSLAAISLLLWTLGMISSLDADLALSDPSQVPGGSMLLYILYGVPITYAVATIGLDRSNGVQRSIDALLAIVLGYLYFVLTFSWTTLHGELSHQSASVIVYTFDVENAFLAVTTLIRYVASETSADRHLFRTLASYAWLYFVCAAYYNHHVALGVAPDIGSYYDIVIDAPFLLFAIVAWSPSSRVAPVRKSSLFVHFVRSGSPLLLSLSVLTLSLLLLYQRQHTNLGIAGVVVAVLGYGLRSILSQVRHIETEDLLRHDRSTLAELAMHDALTGLLNRRAFDEAIEREWRVVQRGDQVISLVLIDIDLFKQYNDSYGHPAGDACLRLVADALRKSLLRPADTLARYGGEEFVVILPGATLAAAGAVTDRLCEHIKQLALRHVASSFGQVTVSAGVACSSSVNGGTAESLIALADRALYEAKRKGRNRVEQAV